MTEQSSNGTRVMRANFHHTTVTGEQIHTHVVLTTVDAWKTTPDSTSPFWQTGTYNDETIAVAIDFTLKTVPQVVPQAPDRVYFPSRN